MFKSGLNGENSKKIDMMNDCMIFECKPLEVPGSNEPINLLLRNRTIGEYYPMMPHVDVDAKYTSSYRDISIFDAQKDGFSKISLEAALNACPRFLSDNRQDGALNFQDVAAENLESDLFLYDDANGQKVAATYLGDMKQEHMPDKALRDFVRSALNAFEQDRQFALRQALEDGLRLIEELEDISPNATDAQNAYFKWVIQAYGTRDRTTVAHAASSRGFDEPSIGPSIGAVGRQRRYLDSEAAGFQIDATTGLCDLPFPKDITMTFTTAGGVVQARPCWDADEKNPLFVPCGYSTFAGLTVLAKRCNAAHYESYNKRASSFVNAVNNLYSRLALVCRSNIFCDAAYQPSYLLKPDGRNTLVANVIAMPQPPLIILGQVDQPNNLFDNQNIVVNINLDLRDSTGAPTGVAPTPAQFLQFFTSEPRINRYFQQAFSMDLGDIDNCYLKDDYAAESDLNDSGPRLRKFEAVLCMLVTHATYADGKSHHISSFTEGPDSVFTASAEKLYSKQEDIELCRDLANNIINALKRVGLDSRGSNIPYAAFKLCVLMLAMRFGPNKVSTTNIFGIFHGLAYARTKKTLIQYVISAAKAYDVFIQPNNTRSIKEILVTQLVNDTLLYSTDTPISQMVQFEDERGAKLNDIDHEILTPLAGSQAMLLYFSRNEIDLMVANNGRYSSKDAVGSKINNTMRNADDMASKLVAYTNRSQRYSKADFGLEHSTLANPGRFSSAPFGDAQFQNNNNVQVYDGGAIYGAKRARGPNGAYRNDRDDPWDTRPRSDRRRGDPLGREEHFEDGSNLSFSYNFVERYHSAVNGNNDILARCACACFLGTGINRVNLRNFIERDVVFPFSFLLFRPFMEFRMASGILAKAGRTTGETIIGPQNFMLGDDSIKKTHYGNYTINLRSLVYTDRNVHLQADMAFDRYVRGMDTSFVTNRSEHDNYVHAGETGKSIYAILEPYDGAEKTMRQNPIDIAGMRANGIPQNTGFEGQRMYSSCDWYKYYFNFTNDDVITMNDLALDQTRGNSLVYLGHTGLYNPKTGQTDLTIINTGHLGPNIYQNVVKVWNGFKTQMQTINFPSVYGGGGQNNRVSLGP